MDTILKEADKKENKPKRDNLSKEIEDSFIGPPSLVFPPEDVFAFNEVRSCADLFRMYKEGYLDIKPDYQRDIVWKDPDMTRFIDSLVKNLPIPSMCFAVDYKTKKWKVIDGLQRMSSIIRFLNPDSKWKLSSISDIHPEISGKEVSELSNPNSDLHKHYRSVSDLTIPLNVLRCDFQKPEHLEYIFTIFYRLNSGGTKLSNQEIRNGIYQGNFNELLKELQNERVWVRLCKFARVRDDRRYRRQELVLRFFAFNDSFESYKGPLVTFLNNYMSDQRYLEVNDIEKRKELFLSTASIVDSKLVMSKSNIIKDSPFFDEVYDRRGGSIIQLESAMIGVARNINSIRECSREEIQKRYRRMMDDDEFTKEKLSGGLFMKDRVQNRIRVAIDSFSDK